MYRGMERGHTPLREEVKAEKVAEKSPEKVTQPKADKPKVKRMPKLERGAETKLCNIEAGGLFEIGDILYRLEGHDGVGGLRVITVTPIPGGFRPSRELLMGDNTICLPVQVV